MARWRGVRGSAADRGAAAVEFALVVPVLLLLVFGIMDYGRFFFDSVSLRQGAREAARQAVVQLPSCTSAATFGAKIACSARAATDTTMGTGSPVVYIPAVTGGWAQGKQLLVCMQSREQGTGFVPLPGGGILSTKVYMSIEVGDVVDPSYISEPAPTTGSDWLRIVDGKPWCS